MAKRYHQGPGSDHFDGVRFFNPNYPDTDRSLGDLLRWQFAGRRVAWQHKHIEQVTPPQRVDGMRITMIGHASLLIQLSGRNLLIDPVWSKRASPFSWAGPRRFNAPGVAFERLPPVDCVLLTHNHFDHLDMPTLMRLWKDHRPRVIAPLGNEAVIHKAEPEMKVETLDWYQSVDLGGGLSVWLHPANHWSARGLRDRRMALWGGFFLKSAAGSLYAVGDTGYGDGRVFRDLEARHGKPDVAIIPIGAYEPRWFMKDQHCNPEESVRIMLDCGARQALGVHWGTFHLTDEGQHAPMEALHQALDSRNIERGRFLALKPGDVFESPIETDGA